MKTHVFVDSVKVVRRRGLLSVLGLAAGVAAVFTIQSLTVSVRREAMLRFSDRNLDVLTIESTRTATSSSVRKPSLVTLDLVQLLPQAVPSLRSVSAMGDYETTAVLDGRTYRVRVAGVESAVFNIHGLGPASGRVLCDLDDQQPVAVLGATQATALAGKEATATLLGRELQIEGTVFGVVGILEPAAVRAGQTAALDDAVAVPVTMFSRRLSATGVSTVFASVDAAANTTAAITGIRQFFDQHTDGAGVQITNPRELRDAVARELRLLTLFLSIAGAVAFVLGGSGVVNAALASVRARHAEIGLRRALGATRGRVQLQILTETLLVCGTGGVAGVVLGAVTTLAVVSLKEWTFVFSPFVASASLALALLVGVIAGGLVGWNAARINPLLAMRQHG